MVTPTPDPDDSSGGCNDLHEILDHLSRVPESAREERLAKFLGQGVDPKLIERAKLFFQIPTDPGEIGAGTVINDFTIEERLDEGGMGVVYRASQGIPRRSVALKVVHPAFVSDEFHSRFAREIDTLSKLEYPGIISIYGGGTYRAPDASQSIPYYAMELIHGSRLTEYTKRENLPLPLRLKILIDILESLQFAHDRGIVHRDLKPGNLMVKKGGQPVILDFGLAQFAHELPPPTSHIHAELSFSGASGTPFYMCPELFMSRAETSFELKSADVYSMGVVAFEVISGQLPYRVSKDPSFREVREAVLNGKVHRLSRIRSDCPPEVEEIIHNAMNNDPSKRYGSASDFAKALIFFLQKEHAEVFVPKSGAPKPLAHWRPGRNEFLPPTDWKLVRRLGSGSVGEVWLAENKDLGKTRAIKFCHEPKRLVSLRREQALLKRLAEKLDESHSFVRIEAVSLDDPPYYIGMEFVDGKELQKWFAENGGNSQIGEMTKLELVAQVADALQAAHEVGVIHRDVKPANILIRNPSDPNGMPSAVLTDFGIGTVISSEVLAATKLGFAERFDTKTEEEIGVGSFTYMAPEVLDGGDGQSATTRSDIFALGVILYQIVVGDFYRTLPRREFLEIEDPILRADIMEFTAHDPMRRPGSAGELADRLRSIEVRRRAEEEDEADRRIAERAAYRRGILRAGAIAATLILIFAGLTIYAFKESTRAHEATGRANDATNLSKLEAAAAMRNSQVAGRAFGSLQLVEEVENSQPTHPRIKNDRVASLSLSDLRPTTKPKSLPAGTFVSDLSADMLTSSYVDQSGRIVISQLPASSNKLTNFSRIDSIKDSILRLKLSRTGTLLAVHHKTSSNETWLSMFQIPVDGELEPTLLKRRLLGFDVGEIGFEFNETAWAFAGDNGAVVVIGLSADGGLIENTLPMKRNPVGSKPSEVEFRPGHNQVAVSYDDSLRVRIIDCESEKEWRLHHPGTITSLSWDPFGSYLATACSDGAVYMWKIPSNPELDYNLLTQYERKYPFNYGVPLDVCFTNLGDTICAVASNRTLVCWNWSTGERVIANTEIGAISNRLSVCDHDRMLVHSIDGSPSFWQLRARGARRTLRLSELSIDSVQGLSFDPSGRFLIAALNYGNFLVDVSYNRLLGGQRIPGNRSAIFSADGRAIYGSSLHGPHRWGLEHEGNSFRVGTNESPQLPDALGPMAASDDFKRQVFVHKDKLLLWNSGYALETKVISTGSLNDFVALDPAGHWIATGRTQDSNVGVFAWGSEKPLLDLSPALDVVFDPEGDRLFVARDHSISVWNYGKTGRWKKVRQKEFSNHSVSAFAVGATMIAVAFDSGEIILARRSDWEEILRIRAGRQPLDAIALDSGEEQLAAIGLSGMLHMVDLAMLLNRSAINPPNVGQPLYDVEIKTGDLSSKTQKFLNRYIQLTGIIESSRKQGGSNPEAYRQRGGTLLDLGRLELARLDYAKSDSIWEGRSIDGYDLKLNLVANVSEIDNIGESLVIVSSVEDQLHLRMFDRTGKMLVDTPANKLHSRPHTSELMTLLKRKPFPDASDLSSSEKQEIINAAVIISGYKPSSKTRASLYFHWSRTFLDALKVRDVKRSAELMRKAVDLNETSPMYQFQMALNDYFLGEFERSLSFLAKVESAKNHFVYPFGKLCQAGCQFRLGESAKARESLSEARSKLKEKEQPFRPPVLQELYVEIEQLSKKNE